MASGARLVAPGVDEAATPASPGRHPSHRDRAGQEEMRSFAKCALGSMTIGRRAPAELKPA
jgi:hypothetical protein